MSVNLNVWNNRDCLLSVFVFSWGFSSLICVGYNVVIHRCLSVHNLSVFNCTYHTVKDGMLILWAKYDWRSGNQFTIKIINRSVLNYFSDLLFASGNHIVDCVQVHTVVSCRVVRHVHIWMIHVKVKVDLSWVCYQSGGVGTVSEQLCIVRGELRNCTAG